MKTIEDIRSAARLRSVLLALIGDANAALFQTYSYVRDALLEHGDRLPEGSDILDRAHELGMLVAELEVLLTSAGVQE